MENNQPIIIKRIKRIAGGHHGGAWKIAFADFATAIVAGTPVEPSFRDGLYVQRVLDAIAHSAANDAAWSAV